MDHHGFNNFFLANHLTIGIVIATLPNQKIKGEMVRTTVGSKIMFVTPSSKIFEGIIYKHMKSYPDPQMLG